MSSECPDEMQAYLNALSTWATRARERRGDWHIITEFLEKELQAGDQDLRRLIDWRSAQVTEQDKKDAAGLLETGFFDNQPTDWRPTTR